MRVVVRVITLATRLPARSSAPSPRSTLRPCCTSVLSASAYSRSERTLPWMQRRMWSSRRSSASCRPSSASCAALLCSAAEKPMACEQGDKTV